MNTPSTDSQSSSFLNRTLRRVRTAWSDLSANLADRKELKLNPELTDDDLKKITAAIDQSLCSPAGEVSARSTAARIGHAYMKLNTSGRERFFRLLATHYDVNDADVDQAIDNYKNASSDSNRVKLRHELGNALLAPRMKLLTLFNALPEGIKFLVDMRAELISLKSESDKDLRRVERDLKHLLSSWFDVGFLKLQQITWDSPASLLEKLIEYEAVHEVANWNDLKNRLAEDRRLFAFFHPNMPSEPLIFVHIALVNGLATKVQALLDPNAPIEDPHNVDTAIFYSISNAQKGLAGISFGNFLIKRVVSEIKKELPQLKQFSTLSPIPTFRKWLEQQLDQTPENLFDEEDLQSIEQAAVTLSTNNHLKDILDLPNWHNNQTACSAIQPVMMRLAAIYLSTRHPHKDRLLDPVAHFHASNGAIIKQINWMGDISPKGMDQSYGLMVNYLYNLDSIDQNSEHYSTSREPALSKEIKQLLAVKK